MKPKAAETQLTLVSASDVTETEQHPKKSQSEGLPATIQLPTVIIGRLANLENGLPSVDHPQNATGTAQPARAGIALSAEHIGREIILAFENGDLEKPVILGLLTDSETELANSSIFDAQIDGERVILTADREIVLRCGEASIILTRAGKVIIKGNYVLSRSAGCNKIKGAVVDIN